MSSGNRGQDRHKQGRLLVSDLILIYYSLFLAAKAAPISRNVSWLVSACVNKLNQLEKLEAAKAA